MVFVGETGIGMWWNDSHTEHITPRQMRKLYLDGKAWYRAGDRAWEVDGKEGTWRYEEAREE